MDLGGWLRSLGLQKYEAVLRDSEIDEILHNLTRDHLRELGFPLGARLELPQMRLPRSPPQIRQLRPRSNCRQPPSAPLRGSTTTEAPEAAGERRHVTVMFCDLVDSTGIAAKLDAEEWRDLVGAYLDTPPRRR